MRPFCSARFAPAVLVAVVAVLALGGSAAAQLPADAQFQYQWNQNGVPVAGTSLTVDPGVPFTLQVYLRQSAGTTNVFVSENGLFGGSVRATYGAPTGTAGVIRVATVDDIVYNPRFNDTATSNSTRRATVDFADFRAATDLTQNAPPDAGNNTRVLLGTFTFQVPGAPGTRTVLRAENIPNTTADNVTFTNLFELDPRISGVNLTINVNPVPEPASVLLVGAAGMGVVASVRRWRTRRRLATMG